VTLVKLVFHLAIARAAIGCGAPSPASPTTTCAAPAGATGSPSSIAEAVTLANALLATQSELQLPCFVQSLDRPLGTLAVNSVFSLQPAAGPRSPRIFLFSNALVMSVVPAGDGAPLLELAEYTSPTRSIKGEIRFPLDAPLAPSLPFERVATPDGTVCGGCHNPEQPADQVTVARAFESEVLRPRSVEIVSLDFITSQTAACDSTKEPERCNMLSSVYGHGQVVTQMFSPDARTIYGN
jgi:hypothetical protein